MNFFLRFLVVAVPVLEQLHARPTEHDSPGPDVLTLKPISLPRYEAVTGLRRRDTKPFSELDPATQSKLIYGSPGHDGQTVLAELDLTAPNGLPIVLMEKFEPLTEKVDCNAQDNVLSLTFNDQQTYDSALAKWSYINENKDDQFLLIANHADCGPDDERQPYKISSVKDESSQRTVYLAAEPAEWSDVAGTYSLAWGHAIDPNPKRLKRRGWWDDVKDGLDDAYQATKETVEDVGEGVADTVQGNANLAKSVSFSVAAGKEGETTALYKDPDGQLNLDCVNCYVKGSFKATGHIKVESWHVKDLSIDVAPQDFKAVVKLEATITAEKKPKTLGDQKEIFSAPVPYAGVSVPKIFKLGAVFSYTVGFNTTFKGEGVVDFGLQASLPNTAKATLSLAGSSSSSASGFDGALTPLFSVKSLSASVNVAAFSKPNLNFGIELSNIGKANVALAFQLPDLSSTLTAKYDAGGACPDDAKKTKTGIDLTNEVAIGVSAEANAELGEDEDSALPKWSKQLWKKPFQLPGHCWPMDIPGLGPAGSEKEDTKPSSTKVATSPTPKPPTGGGGGCRKIKRDQLGRRIVAPC